MDTNEKIKDYSDMAFLPLRRTNIFEASKKYKSIEEIPPEKVFPYILQEYAELYIDYKDLEELYNNAKESFEIYINAYNNLSAELNKYKADNDAKTKRIEVLEKELNNYRSNDELIRNLVSNYNRTRI